jgi:hypothetical protein
MIQLLTGPIKKFSSMLACTVALLLVIASPAFAAGFTDDDQVDQSVIDLSRTYYLSDLTKPHSYRPGKNSFLYQTLHKGERKTLLDLAGSGSVRHLWSTWSIPGSDEVPPGQVLLRVFVDRQTNPSIVGTIDELCRAAQRTGAAFVPFPAFVYKDAYNLYLPIYFSNGIRIEAEALDEINEFYTQIDYRLHDEEKSPARLVSESTASGLALKYAGAASFSKEREQYAMPGLMRAGSVRTCDSPKSTCDFSVNGPGILRKLTLRGDAPSDLELKIYWDGETSPSVKAPARYLFAGFVNAAMESRPGEMTTYFPMPFWRTARIVLQSASNAPFHIAIDCAIDHGPLSTDIPYFHALYRGAQRTTGYAQYPVLQIRGRGLFVGMNLFDSGHNHGGGDATLIDGGTAHPVVLHGICGEDYFGFAWHHVGTMTPLTGAPVHERRYRLHLENPYPFAESIQFLFGTFAGLQPKSVAFWYEFRSSAKEERWAGVDAPWKVLGPLGPETAPPDSVSSQEYKTTVAINEPVQLVEHWQDAQMQSGFLDLTYQFRHYALIERGSGFVPGVNTTKLITYIHSDGNRTVNAVLGHDDRALVQLNGSTVANFPGNAGFAPSSFHISLLRGWNTLELLVSNDENTNWRWSGLSLAFERGIGQNSGLRFSSEQPRDDRRAQGPPPSPVFYRTQNSDEWVRHSLVVQKVYSRVLVVDPSGHAPQELSIPTLDLSARTPGTGPSTRTYKVYAVYRTLQQAADAATGGDLIAVMPGVYAGFVVEDKPSAGEGRYIHFKAMGEPGDVVISQPSRIPDWMILLRATHHVIIQGFNLAGHNMPGIDPASPRAGIMLDGDFGVTGRQTHHIVIIDNFSHNHRKWGFHSRDTHTVLMQNNLFANSALEHSAYVSDGSDNYVIRRNVFFGSNAGGLQCNLDTVSSFHDLIRNPTLKDYAKEEPTREWATGLVKLATERFGENNFPDGKGINFIIEDNVINGNGKAGGGSLNLAGLQDSLIQNNLIYGNYNHGIAQWGDSNPYDRSYVEPGPSAPNQVQSPLDLPLWGCHGNFIRNNTVLMNNKGRAAMQCRHGSWATELRDNILINDKASSIEIDNSSIYRLDARDIVINHLVYTDIPDDLKSLAVNLPEGPNAISEITLERAAGEFVRFSSEPWVIIEGKWWRLNPNRPDFHPKHDSRLLAGSGDTKALEANSARQHRSSRPFIGAFEPASQ